MKQRTSPQHQVSSPSSPHRPPTLEHAHLDKIGASPASTAFNSFQYYRPQKYQGNRSVKKISPSGKAEASAHPSDPTGDPLEMHPYYSHANIEQQQIQELESFKAIEKKSSLEQQLPSNQKQQATGPVLNLDEAVLQLPVSFSRVQPLSRTAQGSFKEDSSLRAPSSKKKPAPTAAHPLKDLNEMRKLRREQRMSQYSGSQTSIISSPVIAKNLRQKQLGGSHDFGGYQFEENPYNLRRESNEYFAVPVEVKEMPDDDMFEEEVEIRFNLAFKKSSIIRTPANQNKHFDFEIEGPPPARKSIRLPKEKVPNVARPMTSKPKIFSQSVLDSAPSGGLPKKEKQTVRPKVAFPSTPKASGRGTATKMKAPTSIKTAAKQPSKKIEGQAPQTLKKGKVTRPLLKRAPTDLELAPKTSLGMLPKSSFIKMSLKGSDLKKATPQKSKPNLSTPQTPQAKTTISLTKPVAAPKQCRPRLAVDGSLYRKVEVNKVPVMPLRQQPGMLTSRHKQTKKITINLESAKKTSSSATKL